MAGRTVVVTRSRAQAPRLVDRLVSLGAEVVELPVIAIGEPSDGGAALADASRRLTSGAYRWVAVTSSNAAVRLLASIGGRAVPPSVRWAAVGEGTARTLIDAGIVPDLVPDVSAAVALAEAFPGPDLGDPDRPGRVAVAGAVLFPRAEVVRGGLASGLRSKGWTVDEVVAYRTQAGDPGPEAVASAGRADAVVFTSSSTVDRTIDLLGRDGIPPVIATIGPITSASVREAGLDVTVEAEVQTIDGLVEALLDVLTGSGHGPRDRREQQQQQQQQ